MIEEIAKPNYYQFRLKLLGHEIFEIEFASSINSNRWIAIGSLVSIAIVIAISAFGDKFVQLYKMIG